MREAGKGLVEFLILPVVRLKALDWTIREVTEREVESDKAHWMQLAGAQVQDSKSASLKLCRNHR